jgi:Trk K+ transport system NAD-binding subunit
MPAIIFLLLRRIRAPLIVLICVYALATLGMTLIPGIDDQGQPWHMGFFHAFYFVSFMGSTIGFGEIPYTFTDGQRAWVLVSIYTSVFAWLYTIGTLLSLIQDQAFRHAVTYQRFKHQVKAQRSPFWVICGYGDTGALLCRWLTERGLGVVVLDISQDALNALELAELQITVPSLRADVLDPENLVVAGIRHTECLGVISLVHSDETNLKVAVSCKLLDPPLQVICRSEFHDTAVNMASFGTDLIVNPFDIFAEYLGLALQDPHKYVMLRWLTGQKGSPLPTAIHPPHGRWILCGYGRFGKALNEYLREEGIEFTVVDPDPEACGAPEDAVRGRGTEAKTLVEAGVKSANGLVAAMDNDANNLSIIITAKQLNPELFTVGRLNNQQNIELFNAADIDLTMRRSELVASWILARITRPLVTEFLERAIRDLPSGEIRTLVERIRGLTEGRRPATWRFRVNDEQSPAIVNQIHSGNAPSIDDLCTDPGTGEQLKCMPLLRERQGNIELLPEPGDVMQEGDYLLFCGRDDLPKHFAWITGNVEMLESVTRTTRHNIPFLRWLARRRAG